MSELVAVIVWFVSTAAIAWMAYWRGRVIEAREWAATFDRYRSYQGLFPDEPTDAEMSALARETGAVE